MNFSELERLIKENPKEADSQAFEWQRFLRLNAEKSPELYFMQTSEEFYKWADSHPEKNIDKSVWIGKEISEAYYYLREQHEEYQMQENGQVESASMPPGLASTPFLATAFLTRPKIIQEDEDYKKIEGKLKEGWLEKNPGKDFATKDGLDYLYGSLDNPAKQSLSSEAENSFRSNPKFKKRVERYDKEAKKIYKNPKDDRALQIHNDITESHIRARLTNLKTNSENDSPEEIRQIIHKKSLEEFSIKYPEKAKAYSQKIQEQQNPQEKKKKNQPSISMSDVNRILKEARAERELLLEPPAYESPGFPTPTSLGQIGQNVGQRAEQGAKQLAQNGLSNVGRAGTRAAAQAGRVATQAITRAAIGFFATPPGWITLIVIGVVLLIVVITFIFVSILRGNAPGQATLEATPSAILAPEATVSPTLAAPL